MLTKNEGLLGVVAILAAAAIVTRRRILLALAAAAAVAYLPWRVFRSAHDLTDADFTVTIGHLRDRLHELPGIVATIAGRVLAPTAWGAATILAVSCWPSPPDACARSPPPGPCCSAPA